MSAVVAIAAPQVAPSPPGHTCPFCEKPWPDQWGPGEQSCCEWLRLAVIADDGDAGDAHPQA